MFNGNYEKMTPRLKSAVADIILTESQGNILQHA